MAGLSRIALALIAMVVSSPAVAQNQAPSAELFAGYSFQTVRIPGSMAFGFPGLTPRYIEPRREHSNGWAFTVNRNLTRLFGVKADVAGAYGAHVVDECVHTLAGFQHRRVQGFDSETGFALVFGGGVDVKLRDRLAIRAFQADYLPAKEGPFWRHHVRLGAGIVFHFGGH